MKKSGKRILSLALTFMMTVTSLPMTVSATSTVADGEGWNFPWWILLVIAGGIILFIIIWKRRKDEEEA